MSNETSIGKAMIQASVDESILKDRLEYEALTNKAIAIDYRELLKKYMGYVYECIDTNEFDAIRFDVGTDDSLTEEQKVAIVELMHEVENE